MICRHCGSEIPEDVRFCPVCGKAVKRQPEVPQSVSGNSKLPVILGCTITALVLLLIGFIVLVLKMNNNDGSTPVAENTSVAETTKPVEPEETAEPTQAVEQTETPKETKEVPVIVKTAPETNNYQTYYVTNCYERITLRRSPDTDSSKICSIPLGKAVSYIESASNGFYKVNYNGNTGYALAAYLTADSGGIVQGEKPIDGHQYQTYYVTNCYRRITLRKRANTDSSEICSIPLGASVSYIEGAGNGFYKVIYNGNTGYALAAYLTPDPSGIMQGDKPSSQSENEITYPIYYVTGCDVSITLRKHPKTSASEICQIPLGAPVSYIETSDNGFYKVIYNGKTGYALASYLN